MNMQSHTDDPVTKILEELREELQGVDFSLYSDGAISRFREKLMEHLKELATQSINVARRQDADSVSATHVSRAHEFLVSSSRRLLFRQLGTIGGILLGASLSTIFSMTMNLQFSTLGVVIASITASAGGFLIALHFASAD